ncbi:hypothetical protein SOVF_208830 [Spinacia oleracea]|nr:hypothetical protein SOVF_208830 [Spinacia oleracea]
MLPSTQISPQISHRCAATGKFFLLAPLQLSLSRNKGGAEERERRRSPIMLVVLPSHRRLWLKD